MRRTAAIGVVVLPVLIFVTMAAVPVPLAAGAVQQSSMDLAGVSKTVTANGLSFPVVDLGTGPAVLLLHGFPDSRFLWRNQIGPLVSAGFRVIAPDLRGFGDAPKPTAVEDYRIPVVARDVIGILDALSIRQARVVGHDFGAALAWYLAGAFPDRVERLAVLSVGTGSGFSTMEQREKSWYFLFFQFEGIAEASLSRNNWQMFKDWTRNQGDQDRYLKDLSRPGALTAALNWYRANVRPQMPVDNQAAPPKIACPVLGVWSDLDPFLTEGQMLKSAERVSGPWRYEKISGAGHWMTVDKPAEVNRLLLDFVR
jgi:pimeloyl-ACP methyl ester carboxylesterase